VRSSLLCDVTQRWLVVGYRRFGTLRNIQGDRRTRVSTWWPAGRSCVNSSSAKAQTFIDWIRTCRMYPAQIPHILLPVKERLLFIRKTRKPEHENHELSPLRNYVPVCLFFHLRFHCVVLKHKNKSSFISTSFLSCTKAHRFNIPLQVSWSYVSTVFHFRYKICGKNTRKILRPLKCVRLSDKYGSLNADCV